MILPKHVIFFGWIHSPLHQQFYLCRRPHRCFLTCPIGNRCYIRDLTNCKKTPTVFFAARFVLQTIYSQRFTTIGEPGNSSLAERGIFQFEFLTLSKLSSDLWFGKVAMKTNQKTMAIMSSGWSHWSSSWLLPRFIFRIYHQILHFNVCHIRWTTVAIFHDHARCSPTVLISDSLS
jgi:hypothetical protein